MPEDTYTIKMMDPMLREDVEVGTAQTSGWANSKR